MNTIHKDLARVVVELKENGLIPPKDSDAPTTRDYLRRITELVTKDSVPLPVERYLELQVDGRSVRLKLYLPDDSDRKIKLMFYCHGGGFRHGSLEDWDAPLRQLARESNIGVLSIGYALSPENRFPTAFVEVVSVIRHALLRGIADKWHIDEYAIGGDSAGANLALGAALALRDTGLPHCRYLMLFYGVYSKDTSSGSWQRLGGYNGFGLSSQSMKQHWRDYLPNNEWDWRAQPIYADLRGLPRTRLVIGDLDPLLDENVLLGARLSASNVDVSTSIIPNIIHGVIRFNEVAQVVRDILTTESELIRNAL